MEERKRITLPMSHETARQLRAGDRVLLSGTVYTGRDAAHKRLAALARAGEPLPFDPRDQTIYYVGPAPTPPGRAMGSAGPTSSYRMDPYTPELLALGLTGMIGKGLRSQQVIDAMICYGAVYFAATGGAAALIAESILSQELVTYEDLGTEAVRRLTIRDFPAIVAIDAQGNDLYQTQPPLYRHTP